MKELLTTNCFDVEETMIIVGSCLPRMQPKAYELLKQKGSAIYEVCLEKEHLNMVVTKIIGMLARGKIKQLIRVNEVKNKRINLNNGYRQ